MSNRLSPELRAKELIKKFQKAIFKNGNPNHIDAHAKECAIYCVNEIIGSLAKIVTLDVHKIADEINYYTEVFKCLNKM